MLVMSCQLILDSIVVSLAPPSGFCHFYFLCVFVVVCRLIQKSKALLFRIVSLMSQKSEQFSAGFFSMKCITGLYSSAPLHVHKYSTTVPVGVNPAAVRRRLTSSTTFCIQGWSSGAGYASLNHRRPRFRRRQSTSMEQSSSRSASIPDIYYFQNTLEVTSV